MGKPTFRVGLSIFADNLDFDGLRDRQRLDNAVEADACSQILSLQGNLPCAAFSIINEAILVARETY